MVNDNNKAAEVPLAAAAAAAAAREPMSMPTRPFIHRKQLRVLYQ